MKLLFLKKALSVCFSVSLIFIMSCGSNGSSDTVQDIPITPPVDVAKTNFSNGSYNFTTDGIDVIISQSRLESYNTNFTAAISKASDNQFTFTASAGLESAILPFAIPFKSSQSALFQSSTTINDFIVTDAILLSDGNNMAFASISHDISNPTDNSVDVGHWVENEKQEITADTFIGIWNFTTLYAHNNIRNNNDKFERIEGVTITITKLSNNELKVIMSKGGIIETIHPVIVNNNQAKIKAPVITEDTLRRTFSIKTDGNHLSLCTLASELNDELDVSCVLGLAEKQ